MDNHNSNVISKLAIQLATKEVELADAQTTIEELKAQLEQKEDEDK